MDYPALLTFLLSNMGALVGVGQFAVILAGGVSLWLKIACLETDIGWIKETLRDKK